MSQFILASPRRHESWVETLVSSRSARQTRLAVPISSIGMVIDIFLLILPSVAVSNLQMDTMRKIGLMVVFGTGIMFVPFLRRLSSAEVHI